MEFSAIHDKNIIREYLSKQDIGNFVYHCNNLESPFWDQTQWFGITENGIVRALAMLILRYETPVLLAATCRDHDRYQEELLGHLRKLIPATLYSHLDVGAARFLDDGTRTTSSCRYYNMRLEDASRALKNDTAGVIQLHVHDRAAVLQLLNESHPDHLFDNEYLEAGYFWGIKQGDAIISLAGVTAFSQEYDLISIGNVTTHPAFRRQGLAMRTVAALLRHLAPSFGGIVLNVKQINLAALGCYRNLGFTEIGSFDEVIFSPVKQDDV